MTLLSAALFAAVVAGAGSAEARRAAGYDGEHVTAAWTDPETGAARTGTFAAWSGYIIRQHGEPALRLHPP